MKGVVVLVACCACGRLAFDPLSDGRGGNGDGAGDSGVDAPPTCSNWGPFGAMNHLVELDGANEEYATAVSADNLLVVFDSDRAAGNYDLWQATRTDAAFPYGAPTAMSAVNTAQGEDNPAVSPDGNTLYFSSDRSGSVRIWTATRSDRAQPFNAPTMLQGPITQPFAVCCPSVSADQLTIYLSVDATGTGLDYEVYEATRPDRASDFGTPVRLTALSSSSNDWTPSISSDGLELFFQTNRGTNYDIYVSRRASTADAWPTAVPLPGLSTASFGEGDPTISYDGTTMYFSMNGAPGGFGGGDIYYATRSCVGGGG